jgi:hypothetical protein
MLPLEHDARRLALAVAGSVRAMAPFVVLMTTGSTPTPPSSIPVFPFVARVSTPPVRFRPVIVPLLVVATSRPPTPVAVMFPLVV